MSLYECLFAVAATVVISYTTASFRNALYTKTPPPCFLHTPRVMIDVHQFFFSLFSSKNQHLAVKVLNPIGYKLAPSGSLRFCEVVSKGLPYGDGGGGFGGRGNRGGGQGVSGGGGGGGGSGGAGKMSEKHVWWLVNTSTRQMIAAYYDARTGMLKEMTLPKCIEVCVLFVVFYFLFFVCMAKRLPVVVVVVCVFSFLLGEGCGE